MRRRSYVFLALFAIFASVAGAQVQSDLSSQSNTIDPADLTDEQLRGFVPQVRDFLYRFGQPLNEDDYSILKHLPSDVTEWNTHAYARFKFEAIELCERADLYDAKGIADEIVRIGDNYYGSLTDRIRDRLSRLSVDGAEIVYRYVISHPVGSHPPPWSALRSIVENNPGSDATETADYWCEVAHDRL